MSRKEIGTATFLPAPTMEYCVRMLAGQGLTDEEIELMYALKDGQVRAWRDLYPDFDKWINEGRSKPDLEVVVAIHKCATGYVQTEQRLVQVNGEPQIMDLEVWHKPDVTAQKYWLSNRMQWKDRHHTSHSGGKGDDSPLTIEVAPETKEDVINSIVGLMQPKSDD